MLSGRCVNTDVSENITAFIFVVEVSRVGQRVVTGRHCMEVASRVDGWERRGNTRNKVRAKGSQERRDRQSKRVLILLALTLRSKKRSSLRSSVPLLTFCVHYFPKLNFQTKFIRIRLLIFERNNILPLSVGLAQYTASVSRPGPIYCLSQETWAYIYI